MRLALLLALLCWGPLASLAQRDVFATPVSVALDSVTIKDALKSISSSSGIRFSYSDSSIPTTKLVSLHAQEQPLGEVLKALFKGSSVEFEWLNERVLNPVFFPLILNKSDAFICSFP